MYFECETHAVLLSIGWLLIVCGRGASSCGTLIACVRVVATRVSFRRTCRIWLTLFWPTCFKNTLKYFIRFSVWKEYEFIH